MVSKPSSAAVLKISSHSLALPFASKRWLFFMSCGCKASWSVSLEGMTLLLSLREPAHLLGAGCVSHFYTR